jgi:beta-ureidopropionase
MSRIVKCGLIQMACPPVPSGPNKVREVVEAMEAKHRPFIERAGEQGVQILVPAGDLQHAVLLPGAVTPSGATAPEAVPGPTTVARMSELRQEVPDGPGGPHLRARSWPGVYYNTAAVIDADGTYLGKYRKAHIPQTHGFWEKYYFKPGNLGYPVFKTRYANVGVYICYDRHFPEGARILGLNGAEIVFNPSATVAGLSQHLWKLEQPAHAVANGYYVGASNRVGTEAPWNIGRFYGSSYFVDPRGKFLATGSEDQDELVVADLDLDVIEEVRRTWQFYRDRRPDSYGPIGQQLP